MPIYLWKDQIQGGNIRNQSGGEIVMMEIAIDLRLMKVYRILMVAYLFEVFKQGMIGLEGEGQVQHHDQQEIGTYHCYFPQSDQANFPENIF